MNQGFLQNPSPWQTKKLKQDGLVFSRNSSLWCGVSSETLFWFLLHERMRWLSDTGMYCWHRCEWQAFFLPWEAQNDGWDLVIWFFGRGGRTFWWELLLGGIPFRTCWVTNQKTCQQHNGLARLVVNLNDRAGWALYDQVSLQTDSP